mmetsp:Transcript_56973/g.101721  ORF Transcript_56973/g.101721 Transcript_56973/m.101721 type:complete len:130 (+) Transcript_56973:1445-1834(+)
MTPAAKVNIGHLVNGQCPWTWTFADFRIHFPTISTKFLCKEEAWTRDAEMSPVALAHRLSTRWGEGQSMSSPWLGIASPVAMPMVRAKGDRIGSEGARTERRSLCCQLSFGPGPAGMLGLRLDVGPEPN